MAQRILVIDDDKKILLLVKKILAKEAFDVVTASTAKSGLKQAVDGGFDLIVLDISMPEMDGYDVCRAIKENPATTDTPVVFLTARTEVHDMLEGYFQGAHLFLTKPFDAKVLVRKIRQLLQSSGRKK